MATAETDQLWGEVPFKLISTPAFKLKEEGKQFHDPFVMQASVMVLLHNIYMRTLNSVYVQAPHVAPEDYEDFINYAYCWYQLMDNHHHGEEDRFFPEVEKYAGKSGLMDMNVEQHHAFTPGLDAYKAYLLSLRGGNEKAFSAAKLTSIIDSFSTALYKHMVEEIPTLLALSRYGDQIPIKEMGIKEGQIASSELEQTGSYMAFMLNHDLTFEEGMWANWPPVPPHIRSGMIHGNAKAHPGWWRFATCDLDEKPKKLFATGSKL